MSCSKYSTNLKYTSKSPCRKGKECTHFPHCTFFHSPENTPDCPFMNTPAGCTNLKCPYAHPKGFVHACIFGEKCKKRDTCKLTHPDQRGLTPSHDVSLPPIPKDILIIDDEKQSSEIMWNCSKSFEPSPKSTSSVDECTEDDGFFVIEDNGVEYLMNPDGIKVGVYTFDGQFIDLRTTIEEDGVKYVVDSNKTKIGVLTSNEHFIDLRPICIDASEPDHENKTSKMIKFEMQQYHPDDEDESDDSDEWETDPDAYN